MPHRLPLFPDPACPAWERIIAPLRACSSSRTFHRQNIWWCKDKKSKKRKRKEEGEKKKNAGTHLSQIQQRLLIHSALFEINLGCIAYLLDDTIKHRTLYHLVSAKSQDGSNTMGNGDWGWNKAEKDR